MEDERFVVAHHEASHAVAHVVLDIPFDYVTIVPTGESEGHLTNLAGDTNPIDYEEFDDDRDFPWCVSTVVGPLGEARATCVRETGSDANCEAFEERAYSDNDDGDIAHLSRVLFLPPVLMAQLWEQGREFVNDNWDYIQRVATALLEHETLSHDDVRQLRQPPNA
jgi:hypothetical protein